MKTINYEHKEKLKNLDVLNKFERACRQFAETAEIPGVEWLEFLAEKSKQESFSEFMHGAFDWKTTPEGFAFWEHISEQ